jgi:Zn-dependent M28 family amino/carboxypeptidase
MKKYLLILGFAIFSGSCTVEVPEVPNPGRIHEFAQSVEGNRIYPCLEQLTQVHLNDTPINNEGFPPDDLFPSDHLTRSAAVGFIARAFEEMGYDADTVVLGNEPQVAYNVVAEYRGTQYPNSVVLVGCHLDAFYGGADDNTSAVAAMLEIARAARNYSFKYTIRFVAFDLEEFGSIGSTRYVEAGYADDVVSAVVMDLIGYSLDVPGSQKDVMGVDLPGTGNFICVIGNENSAAVAQQTILFSKNKNISNAVGVVAPGDGTYFLSSAFMRSDHGLLWFRGLPALFFTDGANFRNPHYHKSTDLPETINKEFLIANTRLVAASVAILAEIEP